MDTPINDGGPAFPGDAFASQYNHGMALRDWFAGMALSGFAGRTCMTASDTLSCAADGWFYRIADAMLAARAQTETLSSKED